MKYYLFMYIADSRILWYGLTQSLCCIHLTKFCFIFCSRSRFADQGTTESKGPNWYLRRYLISVPDGNIDDLQDLPSSVALRAGLDTNESCSERHDEQL